MPTTIEQRFSESDGDLRAYSIKETAGDITIAGGENTVPTGNVASPARAVLVGDFVHLVGTVDFDGADAVLNFTLPEDMWPLQDITDYVHVTDASASPTDAAGKITIAAADGAVAISMLAGTAFATGDAVHLNVLYVRA